MKSEKLICYMCGTVYSKSHSKKSSIFYSSKHEVYSHNDGKITICRNCVNLIFEKYVEKFNDRLYAFYQVCAKFGWYYCEETFKSLDHSENRIGLYVQKSAIGKFKGKTFEDNIAEDFESYQIHKIETDDGGNSMSAQDSDKFFSTEWTGEYTQREIDYLDTYYVGMLTDYKVVTANHHDYARKMAKASLYVDQIQNAVINGDSEAEKQYKKALDAFDLLSKSGKFAESTRSVNDVGLGCFGQIVEQVERGEYIPKHIPVEKDEIDELLEAFQTIHQSL